MNTRSIPRGVVRKLKLKVACHSLQTHSVFEIHMNARSGKSIWLLGGAILLVLALVISSRWAARNSLMWAVLNGSPHVILMRHGEAPGRGEPAGFDLDSCESQRNLSVAGRDEVIRLGNVFRTHHIKVAKIIASRWCRAYETAHLLNLAPVETAAAFDNFDYNRSRAEDLLQGERRLIKDWIGPGRSVDRYS